ncbi:MAG: hypothetical protein NTY70_09020 [Burkholderiales bacterium]|nr:hypothetical protein [Burkholderiales bacterium]
MIAYEWECLACKAPNVTGDEKCSSCGCPSNASVAEMNKFSPQKMERIEFEFDVDVWLFSALIGNLGLFFLFDYSGILVGILLPVVFVVTVVAIIRGWRKFLGLQNGKQ